MKCNTIESCHSCIKSQAYIKVGEEIYYRGRLLKCSAGAVWRPKKGEGTNVKITEPSRILSTGKGRLARIS